MISLANAFEPSSRAAAAHGPEARTPAASQRVGEPGDQRRLGPDDHEVDARVAPPRPASATGSPASASSALAPRARMPALPGAHSSSGCCGERASARTSACSRPPPADDEDPAWAPARAHSEAMKSSIGIAASDS